MADTSYVPRLKTQYQESIRGALIEQFNLANPMQVPRLEKITLNMGVGDAVGDRKIMENAVSDMTLIAGQKPVVTNARKSEAGFKIREGWPIGCKVTLRRDRMYDFMERLISIAIPRIRDFRGLNPKSFDGRGSFSMGITEQIVTALALNLQRGETGSRSKTVSGPLAPGTFRPSIWLKSQS